MTVEEAIKIAECFDYSSGGNFRTDEELAAFAVLYELARRGQRTMDEEQDARESRN